MAVVHVTELVAKALDKVIGENIDLIQVGIDYNELARKLAHEMSKSGLEIQLLAERPTIHGVSAHDQMVCALAHGRFQSIVSTNSTPLDLVSEPLQSEMLADLWVDMFQMAVKDLVEKISEAKPSD